MQELPLGFSTGAALSTHKEGPGGASCPAPWLSRSLVGSSVHAMVAAGCLFCCQVVLWWPKAWLPWGLQL